MTTSQLRWQRTCTSLDFVVQAARHSLESLGIVLRETSNRTRRDYPWWGYDFERTLQLQAANIRIVATIKWIPNIGDSLGREVTASWRSEAWQGVNPNFHQAGGETAISLDLLTYGTFERLACALLRRASDSFPDQITDEAWPVFPDLPSLRTPVDHLVEVRAFHHTAIESVKGLPQGATEQEIEALELAIGWPLPLAYKQYLLFMGRDKEGIFQGSDWFLGSTQLNSIDSELANFNVDYIPLTDTLIFMSHQGYIYGWFDLPVSSEDPPVHFYSESGPNKNQVVHYPHFTTLLLAELRYMASFIKPRPR